MRNRIVGNSRVKIHGQLDTRKYITSRGNRPLWSPAYMSPLCWSYETFLGNPSRTVSSACNEFNRYIYFHFFSIFETMCTYLNWFFANWWANNTRSISGFEYTSARFSILEWTAASSSVKRIQFHGDHSSFISYRTIRNKKRSEFSLTAECPCQILFTKWYMSCFCIMNAIAEVDSLFLSSERTKFKRNT